MEHTVLTASRGMILTDGTDGGKIIYLPSGADAGDWYEIPEADFCGQTVTEEDYRTALREFGVKL